MHFDSRTFKASWVTLCKPSPGFVQVIVMGDRQTHARLWKEYNIHDFSFSEIDLRVFRISGCWMRTQWLITIGFALSIVWGFLFDLWVCYTKYRDDPGNWLGLGLYIATVVISLIILRFEVKEARLILSTDDVSDCFINNEAYQWKMVTSYDTFCLFYRIGSKADCHDKIIKMQFFVLKEGWRLVLVRIPQFILSFIFIRNRLRIDVFSAFFVKILFHSYGMLKLLIALCGYPFISSFVQEKYNIKDFSRFGLSSYVTFLIDLDFNQIITEQRATYETEHSERDVSPGGVHVAISAQELERSQNPTVTATSSIPQPQFQPVPSPIPAGRRQLARHPAPHPAPGYGAQMAWVSPPTTNQPPPATNPQQQQQARPIACSACQTPYQIMMLSPGKVSQSPCPNCGMFNMRAIIFRQPDHILRKASNKPPPARDLRLWLSRCLFCHSTLNAQADSESLNWTD
eukprot:g58699.t1